MIKTRRRYLKVFLMVISFFVTHLAHAELFEIISPVPSTALPQSTVKFQLKPFAGASRHYLKIGSTAGGQEYGRFFSSSETVVAAALPTDGSRLYVTPYSYAEGRWHRRINSSYIYNAAPRAAINSPVPGSTLNTTAARFAWRSIKGATRYALWAGTADDPSAFRRLNVRDLVNRQALGRLPHNGADLYITLRWHDGERWYNETAVKYIAADAPMISSHHTGQTLAGSSDIFRWETGSFSEKRFRGSHAAQEYRLQMGTAAQPDRYGQQIFYRHGIYYSENDSGSVTGLPLDGSEMQATLSWYDGQRWHSEEPLALNSHYSSGDPTHCESTSGIGNQAGIMEMSGYYVPPAHRGRGLLSADSAINTRLLRDNCHSDSQYLTPTAIEVIANENQKGIYLWLAAESGPGVIRVLHSASSSSSGKPVSLYALVADNTDVDRPVFMRLGNHTDWQLIFEPLFPDRPIRISEIRMAQHTDDVTELRKLRFSHNNKFNPHSFVGLNGDPRAVVTAEIAQNFGPAYLGAEGWFPHFDSCGIYQWVAASWEIEEGLKFQEVTADLTVVWINFNAASNDEIIDAINLSVSAGEQLGNPYYTCSRAAPDLIYQDWTGKAAAALAGSYDNGIDLTYE